MSVPAAAWAQGVGALGMSAVVPVALLVPATTQGGLAPVATAVAVGLVVGIPAAVAEWRHPGSEDPSWRAAVATVADLVALGAIALAVAPWVVEAGPLGWALAVAGWAMAWALRSAPLLRASVMVAAVVLAWCAAVVALITGPMPFTLLTPAWSWSAVQSWLGPALLAGLWLGGAGTGQLSMGDHRRPGRDGSPWAGAGAAILLVVAVEILVASGHEGGTSWPRGVVGTVMALVAVSAGATVLARRRDPGTHDGASVVRWRVLGGMVLTVLAAGPALPSWEFAANTALPMGMVGSMMLVAKGSTRDLPTRLAAVAAAVVGVTVWWGATGLQWSEPVVLGVACTATLGSTLALLVLSAPLHAAMLMAWTALVLNASGPPRGMADAAVAALVLAAAFWLVATRTAVAWRRA
ncbi:MAG: hypothetical protein KTR31_24810 [Myxococcales bacterium]|nr:hypothetical protein [Myxococcales bacterium]